MSDRPDGPWTDPDPVRPVPFWSALRDDLVAHVPPADRVRPRRRWALTAAGVVLASPGFHASALYRISHALRHRAGAWASAPVAWLVRHAYGCTIAPTARLHGGLILPHPQGIVVGPGVVVGPRAWIFQNATLGGAPNRTGMPRVGADARIYAGAVLTGPIAVGDRVVVGANAVVHRDVPGLTAVYAPAAELRPIRGGGG